MLSRKRVRGGFAAIFAAVLLGGFSAEAVVNQPPVPCPKTYDTNEDSPIAATLCADDPEGDSITWGIWSPPQNGTLSGTAPNLTYTPGPNFNGVDVFTFKVNDAFSGYQFADVTINVRAVNDRPVADPESVSTPEDTPVAIMLGGLDVDSDPLTFAIHSLPAHGSLSLAGGTATYIPNPDFNGSDSFAFKVDDGSFRSAPATVSVSVTPVNDPPVAVDDTAAAVAGSATSFDVVANDHDVDRDPLTVSISAPAARGALACSPQGNCTYTAPPGASGTESFTYVLSDGGATDSAVVTISILDCPSAVSFMAPGDGYGRAPASGSLFWSAVGAEEYDVYFGPAGSGCSSLAGSTSSNSWYYGGLEEGTAYEWLVVAKKRGCPAARSACSTFRTEDRCTAEAPSIIDPSPQGKIGSPVTLRWNGARGALSYNVYVGFAGASPLLVGTTTETSYTLAGAPGAAIWYVEAQFAECGPVRSEMGRFEVAGQCDELIRPEDIIPAVVGEVTTGKTYRLSWTSPVQGLSFEVQEATNAAFNNAQSQTVSGNAAEFTHQVLNASPFFYRVKPITDCPAASFSSSVRVVVTPVSPADSREPRAVAQAGSTGLVMQPIFIAEPSGNGKTALDASFTAVSDKPWMTVTPSAGTIPPGGTTVIATADPSLMPVGSSTATVEVTNASGASLAAVPVTVSLVQPVSPLPKNNVPADSLIIPTAAHAEGNNSSWRSDIRIANIGSEKIDYELAYTPANVDATKYCKKTSFSINPGQTLAIDDVVRQWFGLGALQDGTNGVLEFHAVPKPGKPVSASSTVATSRLFNATHQGTLGQFVPATSIGRFAGKNSVLSLQALSIAEGMRTNVGIVEGSLQPAVIELTIYDLAGQKLDQFTTELRAGELRQFENLLVARGIKVTNARIEVRVLSETGRIHAYGSVIDGGTGDPLLISGTDLTTLGADRYVIPGAADFETATSNWATDIQIFNASDGPISLKASYYPQDAPETPEVRDVTIGPREVKMLDGVVGSFFGMKNSTGAVHLTSTGISSLVATARTYDRKPEGTAGQFIPAITTNQAIGSANRPLQILQVEESPRMRTNIGLAEVSGQPVTVRIAAILPGVASAPILTYDLKPFEFKQVPALKLMKLTGAYNVRVTVEVTSGAGKVTAYASVVDNESQDATYVPAQ